MAISKKIKDLMKEFGIEFAPSAIEGERKGKRWVTYEAESDGGLSKFQALYDVWQMAAVVDRKRIEEAYSITGLTLQRKVGLHPDQKKRVSGASISEISKDDLKSKLTARLTELEEEVKSVKAQIKKIDAIDDDMLKTISDLMSMK